MLKVQSMKQPVMTAQTLADVQAHLEQRARRIQDDEEETERLREQWRHAEHLKTQLPLARCWRCCGIGFFAFFGACDVCRGFGSQPRGACCLCGEKATTEIGGEQYCRRCKRLAN